MDWTQHQAGAAAALLAAALWSLAVPLYERAGPAIGPAALNLFKTLVGASLTVAALLWRGALVVPVDLANAGWLLLSGAVGLLAGDCFFFCALRRLGSRRTLLVMLASPPFVTLVSALCLGERIPPAAWAGIPLTLAGIAWVVTEREPAGGVGDRSGAAAGIGFGVLSALCWGTSSMLSRHSLSDGGMDPMLSSALRFAACLAGFLVWTAFRPSPAAGLANALRHPRVSLCVVPAAFLGTFLGVWIQQEAFARTTAGVAQTLLATSSLFALPIAALSGERVSPRAAAGAALAVGGVALLSLAG